MTKDHGLLHDVMSNAAFQPIVDIAAADASILYIDNNVVRRFECRYRSVFIFETALLFQNEGQVLIDPVSQMAFAL